MLMTSIIPIFQQEDEVLFTRTMHGVMKNIRHLTTRDRSRTWGPDAWKKVVVCIVSDGRSKINPKTLNVLAAMGVYQVSHLVPETLILQDSMVGLLLTVLLSNGRLFSY